MKGFLIGLLGFALLMQSCETLANNQKEAEPSVKTSQWYIEQIQLYNRDDPQRAIFLANEALVSLENNPDIKSKIKIYNGSAYAHYFKGDYKESMRLAKQAQTFAEKNELNLLLARSFVLQGNVLQNISALDQALANYRKAISLYRLHDSGQELRGVYNNIANTFYSAGQYESALEYFSLASIDSDPPVQQAKTFLGHANVYHQLKKYDLAIEKYQHAFKFYKLAQDEFGKELSQTGLANVYTDINQYAKAFELLEKVLKLSKDSNRRVRETVVYMAYSLALLNSGQVDAAFSHINSAIMIATQIEDNRLLSLALKRKSAILKALKRPEDALNSLNKSIQIEKQYSDERSKNRLAVLQTMLELENKNYEIDLLNSKNRFQQLEIRQQRAFLISSISLILLLSLIIVFFFYQRSQKKIITQHLLVAQQLKELDEVKDQVLANTSHELRTPLNGIVGMSEVLLEDDTLETDQKEKLEIISQCGEQLIELVNDITDIAQLRAGKLSLHLESVSVYEIVHDVCLLLESIANKKSIVLESQIEANLPNVYADSNRLRQILFNLVGNAIKFSDKGQVTIVAKLRNRKVEVQVIDQGVGLPKDKLEVILNPFEQANASSTRKHEGVGLGLPISNELLKLHNSQIEIKSEFGTGSEFKFRLPLAE